MADYCQRQQLQLYTQDVLPESRDCQLLQGGEAGRPKVVLQHCT